jgi:hypothetical protein
MKKYLPFILLGVGVLVLVGAFFVINNKSGNEQFGDEETGLKEVPLEKRPIVSLTPSSDGHYLTLRVEKIVLDADSFDYLFEYKTGDGLSQGVPGSAQISDNGVFETELLLGTESSGKFRYDEGVENGSIELKFRKGGKLVAKFKTDFQMQETEDGFQVTMNTIGGTSETEKSTFSSK